MEGMNIIIPKAIENCQLPDPELRNFYIDLEDRMFWLDDEVTPFLLELTRYIVRWNKEDKDIPIDQRKPIRILIFSPGGDLETYRSVSDIIQLSKTPIIGINMGVAYSAAAREVGVDHATIGRCCNKKTKHAGGFIWVYEGEKPVIPEKPLLVREVGQYSLDKGELIAIHKNAIEATRAIGKNNPSNIRNVCRGEQKSAYGYFWKYLD